MAENFTILHQSHLTTTGQVLLFETVAPTIIKHIRVVSIDSTYTPTITLWKGGTANAGYLWMPARQIPSSWEWVGSMAMEAGVEWYAQASIANLLNVFFNGAEVVAE